MIIGKQFRLGRATLAIDNSDASGITAPSGSIKPCVLAATSGAHGLRKAARSSARTQRPLRLMSSLVCMFFKQDLRFQTLHGVAPPNEVWYCANDLSRGK